MSTSSWSMPSCLMLPVLVTVKSLVVVVIVGRPFLAAMMGWVIARGCAWLAPPAARNWTKAGFPLDASKGVLEPFTGQNCPLISLQKCEKCLLRYNGFLKRRTPDFGDPGRIRTCNPQSRN